MMAAGVLIGAWYALMAALRRFIQAGFWLSFACDLAFGLGAAIIFTAAIIAGDYGRVRTFAVFAALLGAILFGLAFWPLFSGMQRAASTLRKRITAWASENRLIKVIFK